MKYCKQCGKEMHDEALACLRCGYTENEALRERSPKKVILIVVAIVAAVALIIGGLFAWNYLRTEQVKKDLAGTEFSFEEVTFSSYNQERYKFDKNANCKYYYYYTNVMDKAVGYNKEYKIEFKNGKVFLVFAYDTLEVQYNAYGGIKQLCNIDTDEIYD